ncbi:hypothetical protein [Sphingobacterium spiritivorum]|uniref:Adenylosuccinate lyase n=1 Tax=Sphingobacterium spiritivorum ATCC 33861 TaxID=525373 RepID=D7VSU0_SPHSI|nr:hypothetical protein [Sphingobacterium spiritivorum]EFK56841.1 hypothetical protein HMPREF0766_14044 [Sphingobacterium spiritivorum ATCC 33861]QQT35135.1 hypothetical protein I6J01_17850 [Sphingobacterium spiritivorum]WQD36039.1 hypothetical protein U0038_09800 [Sphingobacterium spiritivorum]SUJ03536.1 Uncharacterised protein [Sphingobacterium spiritivorum]
MPDKDNIELEKQIKRFLDVLKRNKQEYLSPIHSGKIDSRALFNLCFDYYDSNLPLHASWLLEKYVKAEPHQLQLLHADIITKLNDVRIEGSQRIFGNILICILDKRSNIVLNSDQEEIIIETIFNWMITPDKAVAVVANCFEILYYLSNKHSWVKEELAAQIEYFLKEGPPSIQSRGKKILSRIRKNI